MSIIPYNFCVTRDAHGNHFLMDLSESIKDEGKRYFSLAETGTYHWLRHPHLTTYEVVANYSEVSTHPCSECEGPVWMVDYLCLSCRKAME